MEYQTAHIERAARLNGRPIVRPSDMESTDIEIRDFSDSNLCGLAWWLDEDYDWTICRDSLGALCLVATEPAAIPAGEAR